MLLVSITPSLQMDTSRGVAADTAEAGLRSPSSAENLLSKGQAGTLLSPGQVGLARQNTGGLPSTMVCAEVRAIDHPHFLCRDSYLNF
jgi:hypothetical protein